MFTFNPKSVEYDVHIADSSLVKCLLKLYLLRILILVFGESINFTLFYSHKIIHGLKNVAIASIPSR